MKLWLILYTANGIGASWGPLPYDMEECLVRAADRQSSIATMIKTKTGESGKPIPDDVVEQLKSWRMTCEEHEARPH